MCDYESHDKMVSKLMKLATRYPNLARVDSVGDSVQQVAAARRPVDAARSPVAAARRVNFPRSLYAHTLQRFAKH